MEKEKHQNYLGCVITTSFVISSIIIFLTLSNLNFTINEIQNLKDLNSSLKSEVETNREYIDTILCELIEEESNDDIIYVNDKNKLELEIEYLKNTIKDITLNNLKISRSTAYTSSKDETEGDPYVTATGETPIPNKTVAVSRDLKKLLGKYIFIDGYGIRYVNDLMAPRWKNKIDIHMSTKDEAFKHGIKEIKYCVIGDQLTSEYLNEFLLEDIKDGIPNK